MMVQTTHTGRGLVRIMLVLAFVLGAFVAVAPDAAASEPASSQRVAQYETRFMENMIDHHMMAVMMADMCVEKAIHGELRESCEQMIADQSAEIQLLQSWLLDWYGIEYEPTMNPGMMRQMQKMAAMEGAEFEMMFMEDMIRHHAGAIREAEKCLERAEHDELLTLCENIIVTQTAEIEQLQTWLCDWYGMCKDM